MPKNTEKEIKTKNIVVVSHIYATGPAHSLENFLKDKANSLLFIGHPFVFAKDRRSFYRYYKQGKLIKESYYSFTSKNQFVTIFKDILVTVSGVIKFGKFDIFIGVDNINSNTGIFLKILGLVKHVFFYTIDYIPTRFPNKVMNAIYHFLDTRAIKHSNVTWNLSSVMVSEREKKGIDKKFREKQIVVPMGTDSDVSTVPFEKLKRFHVAHMGHLLYKQGVQLLIESIPLIIKKYPKFHVDIIGGGDYESSLKEFASELHVEEYITFFGFIKDHAEVEKKLATCIAGIAPYVDNEDNYVRYTDPGKIKAYLSAGLPIIVTDITQIAKEIEKNKCGFAITYSKKDLSEAIIKLLKSDTLLKTFRHNATLMAKNYTWEKIFARAFNSSLQIVNKSDIIR